MEEQEAMETKAPKNLRTEADIWKLYTNGASNEHGSRTGLILVDPEGAETTPKTSNGETLFSLAHGTEAVIPAEIGIPTRRTIQGSDKENEEALMMNLNLLEQRREIAAIGEARRKQQVEKYYNQRVHHKQFKVVEFILRKNELSKVENTGKLGPKWEGPYKVVKTYGTGAYKLRCTDGAEIPRTWHSSNLRKYYM
ncbi:hypothetical protein Tco_0123175 [Tanacetum coccineum]